ncbi:MAG: LysE family transporter [Bacteroidales bacterium]|nr:LysE family transporter [Bacteroidales bacterium]
MKAYLIGMCASAPIGPAAILVIQKSLSYGHKTGFITGLGATTVDTICATVSIFFLAIAEEFIDAHENVIMVVGGIVVAIVGFCMAFSDPFRKMKECDGYSRASVKDYAQAVITAASNPGAVFIMMALFAFFNVGPLEHDMTVAPVILAVSAGSMTYWFFFSGGFSHIRHHLNLSTLLWLNRIAGIIIILIGIAVFGEGIFKLWT